MFVQKYKGEAMKGRHGIVPAYLSLFDTTKICTLLNLWKSLVYMLGS